MDKLQKKPGIETTKKIQELQLLEQNIQNLMMQKQAFQMENNETMNALSELKESEEVYKIIGSILLKTQKIELSKDLERKKELLDLRIKNIEKQEEILRKKMLDLRNEIVQELK